MILAFLAIPVLLGTGFLIPLVGLRNERLTPYLVLFGTFLAFFFSLTAIPSLLAEKVLSMQIGGWMPPFGITIVLDALSALLLLIVTGTAALASLFSLKYIRRRRTEYYSLFCFLLAGLVGVVLTGDIFNLYVFFEIMAVASYSLTSFYRDARAVEGAIKYLIMGSFSTSMILFGIALLYGVTGSLNFAHLATKIAVMKSQIVPLSLGLLLVGFAFKTAIVPWHAWKPDTITATPAPIGAIFTAATTSVGIYIIFRLLFTVFYTPVVVFSFLILAGLATMVLGALLALQQENILRLLAYSVISQTGYVMLAFGVGFFNKMGYVAAVFHLLNMAVFDALLFFVAGVIIWQSGTARMTKFAGIQSRILSSAFVIGALASIGIPFLNGFASKWLIYVVTLHTWPLLMVAAALVTILTATYFLKAYFLIFLSNPKTKSKKIPLSMSFPIFVLALLCVIFGLFPELGINLAELVIQSFDNTLYISAVLG